MKILIADDHALFRDGLSLHLEKIAPHAGCHDRFAVRHNDQFAVRYLTIFLLLTIVIEAL